MATVPNIDAVHAQLVYTDFRFVRQSSKNGKRMSAAVAVEGHHSDQYETNALNHEM